MELGQADVSGVNFIAFRTSSRSGLSGVVQVPPSLRGAVKAELLPTGEQGAPVSTPL